MRIGVDIDGVLADFNSSFVQVIKKLTGITVQLPPKEWAYHRAAGVTAKEEQAIWAYIKNSSDFWYSLGTEPLCEETLQELVWRRIQGDDIYFITSRPGKCAKKQTEEWLVKEGYRLPTVLIADSALDKGRIAEGLALEVFIDDKPENCLAVNTAMNTITFNGVNVQVGPNRTQVYVVDRPYNQELEHLNIRRVPSALAVLEETWDVMAAA